MVSLLVLGFITAQAPAALLVGGLQQQWPTLNVSAVEGTVWQGSALGASVEAGGQVYALSTLTWRFSPLSLISLSPAVQFEGNRQRQKYSGRLSMPLGGALRLEQATAELPASVLPTVDKLPLSGHLSASVTRLTLRDNKVDELEGRVVLQDAALLVGQAQHKLGSIAADLAEADGGLVATLFDLEGFNNLEGALHVKPDGTYQLDSQLALHDTASDSLTTWLPLLGEVSADGQYQLSQRGKLW